MRIQHAGTRIIRGLAWLVACGAVGSALGQNLFPNGGFELGDTSGWTIYNPANHRVQLGLTTDTTQVHSGRYAFSISAFKGGKDGLTLINTAPVAEFAAGTLLRARVLIKTNNLTFTNPKASCSLLLAASDKAGRTLTAAPWNVTFTGTVPYTPTEILLSLPPGAASVALQLNMGAGIKTGSVQFDDASLEMIKDLGPARGDLPLCQLRKDEQGTPRLWIDGQLRTPVLFFGNHGSPVIYDEITKAASAETNIVQIPMSLPWAGTSTGMITQTLRANPKALILPRVFLHAPQGWLERHPDQVILNEERKSTPANLYPSMASDLFFTEVGQQFELLIRFLQNSPYRDRIIGYHPDYLAECFFYYEMNTHYFDYSEVNRQKFTQWLSAKYNEVGKLNHEWKKQYASFADAQIPAPADWEAGDDGLFRDPANPRAVAVADYQTYFNNLTAERLIELAELIKRLTARRSLVAYFYGMQNEFVINGDHHGIGHSGHLGMRRVLASPDIDLICAPISYHDRAPGGAPNMMGIVDSVTLAGKMYLEEDDSRTWLWKDPPPPPYWAYGDEWNTMQCLRRNFGNVLAHNQAIWWMDLCSNGNYNSKAIWENNRKLAATYKDSIQAGLPTRPQVALIYDEDAFFWLRANVHCLTSPNLVLQRSIFQSCGAQVGYYYIEDLDKIPDSVRLIIFVNAFHMNEQEEARINAMKNRGRTLLWLYAPGYVGARDLSLGRVERITGFRLEKSNIDIHPDIWIPPSSHAITQTLAGHLFGSAQSYGETEPFSPTFFGTPATSDSLVLGTYVANGKPALLFKEQPGWNSIFCGAPMLSVPILRAICRQAGVALLVDGDDLKTEDAISYNGRYLCVYARGRGGQRSFQLPGEKIPNGGFEKFTGKLPASGDGRWVSPSKGSLPPCAVVKGTAHTGVNACQTGPFRGKAGQSVVPLSIKLRVEDGKSYQLTGWIQGESVNASAAAQGDSMSIAIQPHAPGSMIQFFKIAEGPSIHITDKKWIPITAAYTHRSARSGGSEEITLQLLIKGAYAVRNLWLDDFSFRESGCLPVRVREVVSGKEIARGVTGWTDSFKKNEQKIYELLPSERVLP